MIKKIVFILIIGFLAVFSLLVSCKSPEEILQDRAATLGASVALTGEAFALTAKAHLIDPITTPTPNPSETAIPAPTIVPTPTPCPAASNGLPDLSIVSVEPIQVIEGADLIVGKETAIKVVVKNEGGPCVQNVEVRVTKDRIVNDTPDTIEYDEFFVFEDGNYNENFQLLSSNKRPFEGDAPYPLHFNQGEEEKTIYFIPDDGRFNPTSVGPNYYVTAEVNPEGKIEESDYDNSADSVMFEVVDTIWGDDEEWVIYFGALDWGDAYDDNHSNFETFCTNTENYLKAVFPIDEDKIVANCNEKGLQFTTDGTGFDEQLDVNDFMNPQLDYVRGFEPSVDTLVLWVPDNWFMLNFPEDSDFFSSNGTAVVGKNVVIVREEAEPYLMGRGAAKTTAHEIGHNFCLYPFREATVDNSEDNRIGERASNGIWVEERIVISDVVTIVMSDNLVRNEFFHFMAGSLGGKRYWINDTDYNHILDRVRQVWQFHC